MNTFRDFLILRICGDISHKIKKKSLLALSNAYALYLSDKVKSTFLLKKVFNGKNNINKRKINIWDFFEMLLEVELVLGFLDRFFYICLVVDDFL